MIAAGMTGFTALVRRLAFDGPALDIPEGIGTERDIAGRKRASRKGLASIMDRELPDLALAPAQAKSPGTAILRGNA